MALLKERKAMLLKAKSNIKFINSLYKRDAMIDNACDIIKSKLLSELGDMEINEIIFDNNKYYRRD